MDKKLKRNETNNNNNNNASELLNNRNTNDDDDTLVDSIFSAHKKLRALIDEEEVITAKREATEITSIAQLDRLIKNAPVAALTVGDTKSEKMKVIIDTLEKCSKENPGAMYLYADINTVPELKAKYNLTQEFTILSFENGISVPYPKKK
jgi:hypothetical protein